MPTGMQPTSSLARHTGTACPWRPSGSFLACCRCSARPGRLKARSLVAIVGVVSWTLAGPAMARCLKDTDCKGDRICNEAGHCVPPPAPAAVQRPNAPAYPSPFSQPAPVPQYPPAPPQYPGVPQSEPPYGYTARPPPSPEYQPPPAQYQQPPPTQAPPPGYAYPPAAPPGNQGIPRASTARGIPLTVSSAGDDDDIDRFVVKVLDPATGRSVSTCTGTRAQACRVALPPGTQSRIHVTLAYSDGKAVELDRGATPTDEPAVATVDIESHNGRRVAGKVLLWTGVGTAALGVADVFLIQAMGLDWTSAALIGLGSSIPIAATLIVVGDIIPKPDKVTLNLGSSRAEGPTADRASGSSVSLAGFGVVPVPGGGGLASAVFTF